MCLHNDDLIGVMLGLKITKKLYSIIRELHVRLKRRKITLL